MGSRRPLIGCCLPPTDWHVDLTWETNTGAEAYWSGPVSAKTRDGAIDAAWWIIKNDRRRNAKRLIKGTAML